MKFKKIFLSLILVLSFFCLVSCKNKKDNSDDKKQDPTVAVMIADRDYFVGESLSTISLQFAKDNCTSGLLEWDDETQTLQLGTHSYKWNFLPTNSNKYNSKSGTISITAINKLETPQVEEGSVKLKAGSVVYIDAPLSTVELECNANVPGTITWANPNSHFVSGTKEYDWKFTPNESDKYSVVKGKISVTASQKQIPVRATVVKNTKNSGYKAYDLFDCSGLEINVEYSAGNVIPRKNIQDNCTVIYKNGTFLSKGDTSVTVKYKEKIDETNSVDLTIDVKIDEVESFIVQKPTFVKDLTYNGTSQEISVVTSAYYSFTPLYMINSGVYDLELTLTDSLNCSWSDSQTDTTIVKCEIKKAELDLSTDGQTVFEYDETAHSVGVIGSGLTKVYYADTLLDADNYESASETPLDTFINAGGYYIYYYAVGDNNHKDSAGRITLTITKQKPVMNLEFCFTLSTGEPIEYPKSYVKVASKQGTEIDKGDLKFTYYTEYNDTKENDTKTLTTTMDGASKVGGAPANHSKNEYYVLVEYAGDNVNFEPASGVGVLYIENADNGFYDVTGTNGFAFKENIYSVETPIKFEDGNAISMISTTGSNLECEYYLEFSVLPKNSDGLIEMAFTSKFGKDETGGENRSNVKSGKVVYLNGQYHLQFADGTLVALSVNEDVSKIVLSYNGGEKTLSKWVFPKYLKSFSAVTIDAGKMSEHNTSNTSTLTIYNDYGTIRFSMKVNTVYVQTAAVGYGGYEEWAGVAEIRIANLEEVDVNGKIKYEPYFVLRCYRTSSNSLSSTGYRASEATEYFDVCWKATEENGETVPTAVTIRAQDSSLLTGIFARLSKLNNDYVVYNESND